MKIRHLSKIALWAFVLGCGLVLAAPSQAAREASFLDPGATTMGSVSSGMAVGVEPKADIDLGDGAVNVARRSTVFFVNQTTVPVEVISTTISSDGGVRADIVTDDCFKQKRIEGSSRCVVEVEIVPTLPGEWRAEIMLAHKGAGRMTRARLSGKATGQAAGQAKDSGLAPSTKEIKPVDFGSVDVLGSPAVRSAMMVNDSAEPITLMAIDVIAAENGLERLDQGCQVDMELQPGETCPVTLLWKPENKGAVSTDLIIRHTGKQGFSVIPVRGIAKADDKDNAKPGKDGESKVASDSLGKGGASKPPSLPTASELEMMVAGRIPPMSGDVLPPGVMNGHLDDRPAAPAGGGVLRLIGTVGNKGVFLLPDGTTTIAGVEEEISLSSRDVVKVVSIFPREAEIFQAGKKKMIPLERAAELVARAAQANREKGQSSAAKKTEKTSSRGSTRSSGD